MEKEYFAFISYQRQDEEWAKWIAYELEHYHLPSTLNGRPDLPENLRPIFRDMDELSAGNLPQQIHNALHNSKNLIVVCSPHAVQSPWVNKEILEFIQTGRVEHIFPFIVDGHPYSQDPDQECFPEAIRSLTGQEERLGANVNESGRDAAVVKLVAGMLGLAFDTLWQRYEREKAEEERKIKEQRDNLLRVQSQFVSEKAHALVEQGNSLLAKKLLLEVLPKNIADPDRPYTPEAENALRYAYTKDDAIINVNGIRSAAFSPDGKLVVSASWDNTIRIWNVKTGMEMKKLEGHMGGVNSAAFSLDGKRIISASEDNTVRIWDVETGGELQKIEGHTDIVNSAAFSRDGKLVVSVSGSNFYFDVDKADNNVRIWDAETGLELRTLEGHTDIVNSAAFSPEGKLVVSASWDGTIRIWEEETGKELRKLEGHTDGATSVSFSPDGKLVVSASLDKTIRIWDVKTGKEMRKLKGHTGGVNSAAFSTDGKLVISASDDATVRIWDVETGNEMQKMEGHMGKVETAFFSADGKHIVSASVDDTFRFWTWNKETELASLICGTHLGKGCSYALSPDGKLFLTIYGGTIDVMDADTGKILHKLEGHTFRVNFATFSQDSKLVASASEDKTVHIWDVRTGREVQKMEGHMGPVKSVAFCSDGKRIVSASFDKTVRIWDVETGREIRKLEGHTNRVEAVFFSSDGKRIVSASFDKTVRIWDVETGREMRKLEGHTGVVRAASFSEDGKWVVSASGDRTVRIWDVETGKEVQELEGHIGPVNSAVFSSDGRNIVSVSHDHTLRVWDVNSGRQIILHTLPHQNDCYGYVTAAFSSDGRRIITEGTLIQIWPFPSLQELIDQTRELFKDCPLTQEERKKYYLD